MAVELIRFSTEYSWSNLETGTLELFNQWYERGELGFLDLPFSSELQERTLAEAGSYAQRFETLYVAGIGGSSLGLRAVLSALVPACRRVCLVDSPDSELIRRSVDLYGGKNAALCVITKSGGTAETLSIFMELRKLLGTDVPVMAITDGNRGSLRKLVQEKNWNSLPVPGNVGGRFSVLSPVGVFPGAFAGAHMKAVLQGAAAVVNDFRESLTESLAGRVAAAFYSRFRTHPVHVFMPYSDRLFETAQWFAQLWAESLGKAEDLNGDHVATGQTPVACRGPADQHSLVQLFMEGPEDKTVTLLSEKVPEQSRPAAGEFSHIQTMAYLQGRNPDELRMAEAEATGEALSERGIPLSRFILPGINATVLGQLFMSLEIATVLCGLQLKINPLDQPGVERGKVLTYRAMGREGY